MQYTTNIQKLIATGKLTVPSLVTIINSILLTIRHGNVKEDISKAKYELKTVLEIISLKYVFSNSNWIAILATIKDTDDPYIKGRLLFIFKQIGSTKEKVYSFLEEVRWEEKFLRQVIEHEILEFSEELAFVIKIRKRTNQNLTDSLIRQMLDRTSKTRIATFARITSMVSILSEAEVLEWKNIQDYFNSMHFICKYDCWKNVQKAEFINEISVIKDPEEKKGFVLAALMALQEKNVSFEFSDAEFEEMIRLAYTDENRDIAFLLAAEHTISSEKLKWVRERMLYRSDKDNMKAMAMIMIDPQTTSADRIAMLDKLKAHDVISRDKIVAAYLMVEKKDPEQSFAAICKYGYLESYSVNDPIYSALFTAFISA